MILDTALGFFVQGPEIHDEFRPGVQDCPQVCCQALGVVSPAVPGWGGSPAGLVVVVVVELLLPGGEPVEQRGRELGIPPVDIAEPSPHSGRGAL